MALREPKANSFAVQSHASDAAIAGLGFLAGDAFASGWLEREKGRWLQVSDSPVGCARAALLGRIAGARPEPKGYADNGRVMM